MPLSSGWRSKSAAISETVTTFSLSLYYLFFLSSTLVIYIFYFVRGRSTTTIIPCISSIWYKIYTVFLALATIILVVLAALETRPTPCGKHTTWPASVSEVIDVELCPVLYPLKSSSLELPFGIAVKNPNGINGTIALGDGQFRVVDFDGYFLGVAGINRVAAFANSSAYVH